MCGDLAEITYYKFITLNEQESYTNLKEEVSGAIADWRSVLNGGNLNEVEELEIYIPDRKGELAFELMNMYREAKQMQTALINQNDSKTVFQELGRVCEDLIEIFLKLRRDTEEILTIAENFLDANILVPEDNVQNQGLTRDRIEKFEIIEADNSFVGERCGICLDELEVGRKMKRLDCDGQHSFCHGCIDNWFADNATCPFCRHKF